MTEPPRHPHGAFYRAHSALAGRGWLKGKTEALALRLCWPAGLSPSMQTLSLSITPAQTAAWRKQIFQQLTERTKRELENFRHYEQAVEQVSGWAVYQPSGEVAGCGPVSSWLGGKRSLPAQLRPWGPRYRSNLSGGGWGSAVIPFPLEGTP